MRLFFFAFLLVVGFSSLSFASAIVEITTTKLPNGTVGTPFSAAVSANGGCTPYKWAVPSGKLPSGISKTTSKNTESLDLTGTPTAAGTYSFRVSVTGCGGHMSEMDYEMTVQSTANHVVDLSWRASSSGNVAGYNVYRSPNENTWDKINVSLVGSTLYDDATVADGSTYYYAVTAVDLEGVESGKSTIVRVVIP
jgi:uncharacterized membrane protein